MTHLPPHASDHPLIILQVQGSRKFRHKGQRGFKFEEAWLLLDECEEVIKTAWEKGGDKASELGLAKQKIVACAIELHAWGSSKAQPNSEEIKGPFGCS